MTNAKGVLKQSDLDEIQRMGYRNADDIAISIARSLERLEERIDYAESRIHSRISELEDKLRTEFES
jgi:hypothetical protein